MKFFLPLLLIPILLMSCVVPLNAEDAAYKTIHALQAKNMKALASLVHPEKGVQFTPYTNINFEDDLAFPGEELRLLMDDTTKHMWGHHDGSGEPIRLTFTEYFDKFIYDHDYVDAEEVVWNTPMQHGSPIDNVRDVYPNAQVVEYHFSGFDPQYDGMDWSSLRLVFEEYEGSWYLVAVIHDQWGP